MRFTIILSLFLVTILSACSSTPSQSTTTGSDRTVNGCVPTAGYSWCTSTNQCERPWELGQKEDFAQTKEAFDRFCKNPAENVEG